MEIRISGGAQKSLRRVPQYIARKFEYWVDMIQYVGLQEARKHKGFHDEPLTGKRFGQRSVRLSRAYRIFYRGSGINQIEVLEVNKHGY